MLDRLAGAMLAAPAEPPPGKGPEWGKAAPIGLLVILLLCAAMWLLFRNMSKHLRKVREAAAAEESGGAEFGAVKSSAAAKSGAVKPGVAASRAAGAAPAGSSSDPDPGESAALTGEPATDSEPESAIEKPDQDS